MIKKGLKVLVLAGKDKKKEGEVIELDRRNNRAKVKDINMVKKHVKTTKEKKGGIFSKESFINLSNLNTGLPESDIGVSMTSGLTNFAARIIFKTSPCFFPFVLVI